MLIISIIALVIAIIVYILIGIIAGKNFKGVGDLLPLTIGRKAQVKNSREFAASTVATTISLATVIMAFFELASYFGFWLFWTVLTTSFGLLVVKLMSKRIWKKISEYDHRPSLHEFLGDQYDSSILTIVGASCTTMGFLGAFAIELTVGSKFFSGLITDVPQWFVIVVLSSVVFIYTSYGGFRAVVIADRIQMLSIWTLIAAILTFISFHFWKSGGIIENILKLPTNLVDFSWREGLTSFLIGIFMINVPTFISDMSIWQRIAAAPKADIVSKGLNISILSSVATWGIFVLISCVSLLVIKPDTAINPLITFTYYIGSNLTFFTSFILIFVILGLYGAMLSTASTQLIAVSHSIYEDIISRSKRIALAKRADSVSELRLSRIILISSALLSSLLVQLLSWLGFSIADLVFAIYGAQLGLFPPIIVALFSNKKYIKKYSSTAAIAIILGFVTGWGAAIYGKIISNSNIIFLSPVISLLTSTIIFIAGILFKKKAA